MSTRPKTKRAAQITGLENAEMRAIIAEGFGGYQDLKPADIPKPTVSDGRVLLRRRPASRLRASTRPQVLPQELYESGIYDVGGGSHVASSTKSGCVAQRVAPPRRERRHP